jgi:hypothetical protein
MYFNSSLPQIGTLQNVDVVNGQPTTEISAWWQWWVRDQDNFPVSLPLSVSEDDSILCSLVVVTPTKVKFLIKNQTTGYMIAPFDQVAPMAQMTHMPSPIQVEISGATAEWIMERPTKLQSTQLYELPNYNRVEFKNCLAVSASSEMADRTHDLSNANLINMMAVREHPHRTVPISVAQRQGNNGIITTP